MLFSPLIYCSNFMASLIPNELREKITSWGQSHVFKYVDSPEYKISDADILTFVAQLESVDFPRVKNLLAKAKADGGETAATEYTAPSADEIYSLDTQTEEKKTVWRSIGLAAIRAGQVAVCVLAGGQGTRMGLPADESKGMFLMDKLMSKKFVFQLFIERLIRLRELAGPETKLPLLIMTSPINNLKITKFLESHAFFGYPSNEVIIFQQGTLPALTLDGNLLLEGHARLAISPDGNGGIYNSLVSGGVLDRMKKSGVKSLHVMAVDNAIGSPADPMFIGACLESGVEIGNKVVWKSDWKEKVGVIAKRNGRTSVVEYSDLYNPDLGIDNPLIRAVNGGGRLSFGAGNICNHFYSVQGLDRILPQITSQYHLAVKKIAAVDPVTHVVSKPSSNNGLKLESFIFDAFELATSSLIVEADRVSEFSPMKNLTGEDSPETAVAQMELTHRRWLIAAGAVVNEGVRVEVLPEVSYSGEGLETVFGVVFDKDTIVDREWIKKHQ
jgi:UDP-N-acetylglucosamine/UDP-N-acetylgalactosamine diphosphorylase